MSMHFRSSKKECRSFDVDALNLVSEILTGLSVIRAFGRDKRKKSGLMKLLQTQLFTNRVMTFMMPLMFIMYGVTILIVWVSAQVSMPDTIQVGAMTAFITYSDAYHDVIMLPRFAADRTMFY